MGLISSGITGIHAATIGLLTTEHNIANASTPGYNRQRIVQSQVAPLFSGAGFIGQGTRVNTIERSYNQYLSRQVLQSQTTASDLRAYASQISQIDNLLADPNAGLSPALQDFFRGVQQVSADPASIPARRAMVSTSQALVARFQSIESRLSDIADGVNTQIGTVVDEINSYARQVADINQRIMVANASANQPANDLLDQRDQILAELNKYIRVTTVEQRDGSFSVFIGTGQQLVVGNQVSQLDARPSAADAEQLSVGYLVGGVYQELPEFVLSGGELGGLLRFRRESLDAALNGLGQVAASLALTFNAQHALGQDLLGNVAGDSEFAANFFTLAVPKAVANSLNEGSAVVTAGFSPTPPSSGNFYTNLTTSDYRLAFDGTTFSVTRLSDNTQWSNASLATLSSTVSASEGFTLTLSSGTFAADDSFLIRPTREMARNINLNGVIVGDVRKIAAAFPVRTQALSTNTGNGVISAGEPVSGFPPPSANVDITYASGTATLSNFPNGTVVVTTPAGVTTSYPITAATDQVPYTSGATIEVQGATGAFRIKLEGTLADGDVFRVGPNSGGVSDGRNILRLGQLQTQNTSFGESTTFQGAYARLVSENGNKTREIQVTLSAQESLLEQATAAREAESGVNLDEEAANLIRYQQAYQAAARVIDTASRLFDELLSLGR